MSDRNDLGNDPAENRTEKGNDSSARDGKLMMLIKVVVLAMSLIESRKRNALLRSRRAAINRR